MTPKLPSGSFALTDLALFTGYDMVERGFLEVREGCITNVGIGEYAGSAPACSLPGFTIMPGLIDAHIHALGGNTNSVEQSLRFGVTTVCDMHNHPPHVRQLQALVRDQTNYARYADYKSCGVGATIQGGWPEPVMLLHSDTPQTRALVNGWAKVNEPADAPAFVSRQIDECGAEYIKLFHELGDSLKIDMPSKPSIALQRAVVQAAHDRGLPIVAHALSYQGMLELLDCGVDGLNHAPLDRATSDDYLRLMTASGAHLNPTLTCCASHSDEADDLQKRSHADPLAKRLLLSHSPPKAMCMGNHSASVEHAIEVTRKAYAAGVPILVGSDASGAAEGQVYGLGMHTEMHLLAARVGMKPVDILKSATSTIAERYRFADRGSLLTGKRADLLLLKGSVNDLWDDPERICLPIKGVWRQGVLCEAFKS